MNCVWLSFQSILLLCFINVSIKAANDTILFSDMSRCVPSAAISGKADKSHWQAVDYETAGFKGVMLMTTPETTAPDITLQLNVKGWYSIYVGLYRIYPDDGIRVKLTNDETTTFVKADKSYDVLEELYWKSADLSGQNIIFKQPSLHPSMCYIAFVKLVSMSAAEVENFKQAIKRNETKRLIALNDGHGVFYSKKPLTTEELIEDIEPYRNSDFSKLFWCIGAGGDNFTFENKLGRLYGEGIDAYPRTGDRNIYESIKALNSKGIDPIKTVVDYTHKCGLESYLSLRMGAFAHNQPWDGILNGNFYSQHPEWHCRDIDGSEIVRMSYAFPEVQDFVIDIFNLMATYRPDGIDMIFNRGAPYLLYEEPLIKGYIVITGKDPRKLDEKDKDYIKYRASVMTEFMRKVRAELAVYCTKHNLNKMKIAVHALNDEETNMFFGLDITEWARLGLVDEIIAYPWNDGKIDVDYFVNAVKGTNCKLYIEMMPRQMSPEDYRKKAIEYYEKGVYGLSFWDTNSRHTKLKQWSMITRLGHKDELKNWNDGNGKYFKVIPLKKIGGYKVDKYTPGDCY